MIHLILSFHQLLGFQRDLIQWKFFNNQIVYYLFIAVPDDGGQDPLIVLWIFRLYLRYNQAPPAAQDVQCPFCIFNKRTYPSIDVPRVLLSAASWWPMLTTAVLSCIYSYSNQAYPMPKKIVKFIHTSVFQLYRLTWYCSVRLCLVHVDLERMGRYNAMDIWLCNFWNHTYKFSLLLV
jgi:hypothetical protein